MNISLFKVFMSQDVLDPINKTLMSGFITQGKMVEEFEKKLQEIGYHIKTAILDTNKITNIPQHRERIYIIGFRDKEKYDKFNFEFPEQEQGKICDMLEENVDDKYYY